MKKLKTTKHKEEERKRKNKIQMPETLRKKYSKSEIG